MDYFDAMRNGSSSTYFKMKERIDKLDERCSKLIDKVFKLKGENIQLMALVEQMHEALQKFCDAEPDDGHGCPMLQEDRNCQCALRDIEDWMRDLGIEVVE